MDFSRRASLTEAMDAPGIPYPAFESCLRDLARVNRLTLAYRPTLAWLATAARRIETRPVRILDVASGYGDMLRRIFGWAAAAGIEVALTGVDLNPSSARAAAAATPPGWPIRYVTGDVFAFEPETQPDLIVSSLFTHHLKDAELIAFIRWMEERAVTGWFINDLHRHWLPYWFTRVAFPLMRFDPMVISDGPVSIARAFTRADWARAVAKAVLPADTVEIRWWMPFRYTVSRLR